MNYKYGHFISKLKFTIFALSLFANYFQYELYNKDKKSGKKLDYNKFKEIVNIIFDKAKKMLIPHMKIY